MTRRRIVEGMLAVALVMGPVSEAIAQCAADAVVAGTTCLDRYEASVWRVPDPIAANAGLVTKIRAGRATAADLVAAGATQRGASRDDYAPCADDGQNCTNDLFAVSLPSVIPSAFVTWFQAQGACANSEKRLPTNAEWQVGANGTPDPGPDDGTTDCNTARGVVSLTGVRGRCTSARGASDMVGNLAEWVAEWVPRSTACPGWGGFSDDAMCLAGASANTVAGPGALVRGGGSFGGAINGPLAVFGTFTPNDAEDFVGFRCARSLPEPSRLAQWIPGFVALAALARVRRRSTCCG